MYVKRKPNVPPLTWISNPVFAQAFSLEQAIFKIEIDWFPFLDKYFEPVTDNDLNEFLNGDIQFPCWYEKPK